MKEENWQQGFNIELSPLEKSNLEIEETALKILPVSLHRGKLDINRIKRESWVEGAKYQRDKMALEITNIFKPQISLQIHGAGV